MDKNRGLGVQHISDKVSYGDFYNKLHPGLKEPFNALMAYANADAIATQKLFEILNKEPQHVPNIKNVIFNPPATIVYWEDNTKTVVKASNDEFSKEIGLAMAISKKAFGNSGNYFNNFKKWVDTPCAKPGSAAYKVGSVITLDLGPEFGERIATAQEVKPNGTVIFLFDDILLEKRMNPKATNEGGFQKTELNEWLQNVLLQLFPKDMRVCNLTLPTYGQIFGHDDWYRDVMVPDNDEQWPLMKKDRRAKLNGSYDWYWLQNATKKSVSAAAFADVSYDGFAYYGGANLGSASYSYGVRPCFAIEPLCGDK